MFGDNIRANMELHHSEVSILSDVRTDMTFFKWESVAFTRINTILGNKYNVHTWS